MSQSPLNRSTRRPLQAFAHVPSRLSKQPSTPDLSSGASGDEVAADSPSAGRSRASIATPSSSKSLSKARASYVSAGTSTEEQADATLSASDANHAGSQAHTPIPRSRTHGDFSTPIRRDTPLRVAAAGSHTPIHYSPYALATPPPGMSKSASTPFDMAASAKAARVAGERKAREDPTTATPGRSDRRKSRAFIRQKSLFERMIAAPANIIEKIALITPTSMDELLPPERYAHPITLGIHAVHFLCLAPLWSYSDQAGSILRNAPDRSVGGRWGQWEEEHKSKGWGLSVAVFTLLLLALSLGNAIYLFTRFRTYDMQLRSAAEPPSSPHASSIPSPQRAAQDPFVEPTKQAETTPAQKVLRITWRAVVFIIRSSTAAVMSMMGRPTDTPISPFGTEDRIQSLRVWDPPDFCLAFFCAYPPSAPILAYLLTASHTFLTPMLHLSSAMLLTHLALNFRQLVKDRMILAAEVMKEYDRKFVYKRIFGGKVDRGVQTHEAEMVY